jgi:hypothetical protein
VVAGWLMADLVREQNNCHEKKLGEEWLTWAPFICWTIDFLRSFDQQSRQLAVEIQCPRPFAEVQDYWLNNGLAHGLLTTWSWYKFLRRMLNLLKKWPNIVVRLSKPPRDGEGPFRETTTKPFYYNNSRPVRTKLAMTFCGKNREIEF